jgi:hypothetical protein
MPVMTQEHLRLKLRFPEVIYKRNLFQLALFQFNYEGSLLRAGFPQHVIDRFKLGIEFGLEYNANGLKDKDAWMAFTLFNVDESQLTAFNSLIVEHTRPNEEVLELFERFPDPLSILTFLELFFSDNSSGDDSLA